MKDPKENIGSADITLPAMKVEGMLKHQYEMILDMAKDALDKSEKELSVILACASCEILTERAFRLLFSYKRIEYLYDSVIERTWEYNNITRKKSRDLYIILSEDNITKTFTSWGAYCEHYKRRHEIAHRGREVTREEAEKSIKVVKEYIDHLEKILENKKPKGWGN